MIGWINQEFRLSANFKSLNVTLESADYFKTFPARVFQDLDIYDTNIWVADSKWHFFLNSMCAMIYIGM